MADVMTPNPHSVGSDQPLSAARALLAKHDIRHLPVREGGALVGLISERDILFALAVEEQHGLALKVQELVMPDPYFVSPNTPLRTTLDHMMHAKIGSCLVVEGDQLVGIYTTVDVCRDFSTLLAEKERDAR